MAGSELNIICPAGDVKPLTTPLRGRVSRYGSGLPATDCAAGETAARGEEAQFQNCAAQPSYIALP